MVLTRLKYALALIAILTSLAAAGPQAPRQDITVQQRMIVLESDGSILRVNELYKVENNSLSGRTKAAKITVLPLAEKSRYTLDYPVKPGQTQFTVTYNLPYKGQFKINPRVTAPTAQLMVVAPDTMALVPESNSVLLPA